MRKPSFTILAVIALAAFTFTSCDKDDPETPAYTLKVVDFEDATLNANGILTDSYTGSGLTFVYNYNVTYGSWDGIVVSNNTDKTTAGSGNQYSVYGTGGANGSAKFAISSIFGTSEMLFGEGDAYEIEYAYFNNSTYAYLAMKEGKDGFKDQTLFSDGDWFKLTITGYSAAGAKTADKEVYLADYREGKTFIMSDWTKIDLTSLGKVNKVTFALSSTDNDPDGGWMNTPGYFCIDNVAYREYVTK